MFVTMLVVFYIRSALVTKRCSYVDNGRGKLFRGDSHSICPCRQLTFS
jgi:hypothetical protein